MPLLKIFKYLLSVKNQIISYQQKVCQNISYQLKFWANISYRLIPSRPSTNAAATADCNLIYRK